MSLPAAELARRVAKRPTDTSDSPPVSSTLCVSVVIPTHNPRMDYLARVLEALRAQTLPREQWEIIVVDNGSKQPLRATGLIDEETKRPRDAKQEAEGIREEGEVAEGVCQEAVSPSLGSVEQYFGMAVAPKRAESEIGEQRSDAMQGDLKLTNLKRNTPELELGWHANARVVREEELGLTFARLRGFAEAKGELIVMVDDDNVLAPDYLANAVKIAEEHEDIGAFGGKCLPEFETQPEPWMEEFLPLLALRDHGDKEIIAGDTRSADGSRRVYPDQAAPIGAGMVLRSSAARAYAERLDQETKSLIDKKTAERLRRRSGLRVAGSESDGVSVAQAEQSPNHCPTEPPKHRAASVITDRRGDSLASAGDNDLVFTILRDGWKVGYFPQLRVTHLIPSNRLTVDYLARANRGVQRSWVEVLRKHGACPWAAISRSSLLLRKLKAWFANRTWSPAGKIRWNGCCGNFEGRIQY